MANNNILHAIVFIQNWGEENTVLDFLNQNTHVISVFHIMGRHSYLIDSNFDSKTQLEDWISKVKSLKLASGMPAIISLQTQKVIQVLKRKEDFDLKDYKDLRECYHFFMLIDNPHHDEGLIKLLKAKEIVHSILHIQGRNSFIIEVITDAYNDYKSLLTKMKTLKTIHHIETLEVILVNKYRNQVMDAGGNLVYPKKDIRELYSL
ncbi:MAG: hypothetical protein JXN64_08235 [Spirochaetes bacterium]|nr:hypothetical protein [Spirochaetota bacterium]